MKKLIVVVNDLERSGKSTLARAISHHLKNTDVPHLFVTSNEMDMSDTFAGEFWDLEEQIELSQLIAAIDSHKAVVVDVHSGAARNWGEFCESEDLENLLAELDCEMTLVMPNTRTERCNEEIFDLTEIFTDTADYIVAHLPGDPRTEVKWKTSAAEKALRYLGAADLEIPALSDELKTALDNAGLDIVEALNSPSSLPRFAEIQMTQWLDKVGQRLARANEYLIPEEQGTFALEY